MMDDRGGMNGKMISKMIRMKKKGTFRPDWDVAGQEAVDPNAAWDAEMDQRVDETLGDPEHESPSPREMGEDESSQDVHQLKRSIARIAKYFESL
jgi:hypothetical protein